MKDGADGGGAGDVVGEDEEGVFAWNDAEAVPFADADGREGEEKQSSADVAKGRRKWKWAYTCRRCGSEPQRPAS